MDGIPDWLVMAETAVPVYSYCPPEEKTPARDRYEVVRVITPMKLDGSLFDRQDAFYYPYAGFRDARRGGPTYIVYERKPSDYQTASPDVISRRMAPRVLSSAVDVVRRG